MNIKFEEEDTDKTITTESEELQMTFDKYNKLESGHKNITKNPSKNVNYINNTNSSPSCSFKSLDIIPLIKPFSNYNKLKIENNSSSDNFKNKIFIITKIKKNELISEYPQDYRYFSGIKPDYNMTNSNQRINKLKINLANNKRKTKLSIN